MHPRVTLINVFTVAPLDQARLVELLSAATTNAVRHAPGFLSARLYRSLDGTKVTMHADWSSEEHYRAMRANQGPISYLEEALAVAERFEPVMYELAESFVSSMDPPG
jgi:quinol monooxygenase YgiN